MVSKNEDFVEGVFFMSEKKDQTIFALDIGTRSVVGMVIQPENDGERCKVLGYEVAEHRERSMMDGQIHDVVAVADVMENVKKKLETKFGPLKEVAVAAAGRSLKTCRAFGERNILGQPLLNNDDVLALELAAVQEAQAQLAANQDLMDKHEYYCVGYSVVNYYLDDDPIGNLIDQKGETAKAEVIATFLPKVVVDSLLAALQRSGLELKALTLEPIAAINGLIPSSMRRLNIILVDIGAGTSDIAIAAEGTVTAYGMVPVAGDEITEALSNAYILDFHVAERVKRELITKQEITFSDILGMEQTLPSSEIIKQIGHAVDNLAKMITNKIMELNGKTPQAVMLIGGGSLTPGLAEKTAEMLGLPSTRVAVRGAEAIQMIANESVSIKGPEFVTPVGIAITANQHPIRYTTVIINDQTLRLFDVKKLLIGDVLLQAGIDIKKLHGRPGLAMTIKVNGKTTFIPGEHGTPPILLRNGEEARLDTAVQDSDEIAVIPGKDGMSATALLKDVIPMVDTLDIYINEQPHSLPPIIQVNGKEGSTDSELHDRDEIEVRLPITIAEVLAMTGWNPDEMVQTEISVKVNGEQRSLPNRKLRVIAGEKEAGPQMRVRQGEQIFISHDILNAPCIEDILSPEEKNLFHIRVNFNDQWITVPTNEYEMYLKGEKVDLAEPLYRGANIEIRQNESKKPIFSDVFRVVDPVNDQPRPEGTYTFITLINGEQADFHSAIQNGDRLELRWE